jgi:vacuolar protein sorting-associated protein 18
MGKRKYIKDLQNEVSRGLSTGVKREKMIRELDDLVAEACILCGDYGIKQIDAPFITAHDNAEEWAI